jgi:hypothetical protein
VVIIAGVRIGIKTPPRTATNFWTPQNAVRDIDELDTKILPPAVAQNIGQLSPGNGQTGWRARAERLNCFRSAVVLKLRQASAIADGGVGRMTAG